MALETCLIAIAHEISQQCVGSIKYTNIVLINNVQNQDNLEPSCYIIMRKNNDITILKQKVANQSTHKILFFVSVMLSYMNIK